MRFTTRNLIVAFAVMQAVMTVSSLYIVVTRSSGRPFHARRDTPQYLRQPLAFF
jgi:hypothetical protein